MACQSSMSCKYQTIYKPTIAIHPIRTATPKKKPKPRCTELPRNEATETHSSMHRVHYLNAKVLSMGSPPANEIIPGLLMYWYSALSTPCQKYAEVRAENERKA
jgi:hypothetical protein